MRRQLSLTTSYYIRKLLHQNLDRLTSVLAVGAGLKADSLSDLNAVLESLYLGEQEVDAAIEQLEYFGTFHQTLSHQGAKHHQELRNAEQKIFWLLGFKLRELAHHGLILVVDDTLLNVRLLSMALTKHGYEVCSTNTSVSVVATTIEEKPDLILLDIMMPGIDGYEVCNRLKANPLTCEIPIIFISTMNDPLDKVKAFGVGGTDYIAKPFQMEEVLARIEHQLKIRVLQKRLEAQNIRLQQEIQEHKNTEARYHDSFENAVDGIFQTSLKGTYLRVNPALARIYGYASPKDLIEKLTDISQQLYVQPQRRSEFIACFEQQETVLDFESQIYRQDGSVIWISETVRKVRDTTGAFLFYEGTVRDVTTRIQKASC